MPYNEAELSRIVQEARRPFESKRDELWTARRQIRHRQSEPWLPERLKAMSKHIIYRDSTPGFYIEGMKQRLGVNAINLEVRATGDPGPKDEKRIGKIENWFYGVLAALDPVGQVDSDLRDGQVGDGVSFAELEFLPRFTPDTGSKKSLDEQRKYAPLPYRLSAPDPKGLAWMPFDVSRGLKLMVKTMDVPLIDVADAWRDDDIRLVYEEVNGKGRITPQPFIYGGEQASTVMANDIGRVVRIVQISTPHDIYHCVDPSVTTIGQGYSRTAEIKLIKSYPNPIAEVPFYACWGRKTREADPAFMYQPLALEQLDSADYKNQMMTLRGGRAVLEAMKPWPLMNNSGGELKEMPESIEPGWLTLPSGVSIGTFPDNPVPDLNLIINDIKENEQLYQLSLMNNQQVGKSTPAWGASLFNEEIMGFLLGAVSSRANLYRDVLNAVAKCTCNKHAKDGPVYVRSTERSQKRPERGEVDMYVGVSAEDLEPHSYRLEVSIDAKTQSQKSAETEYGRRLKDEGTISQETYETDYVGIEDRDAEQRRKDREMIERSLVSPQIAAVEHVREVMRPFMGNMIDVVFGPSPLAQLQAPPPVDEGMGEPSEYPVSPGMGMPLDLQEPPSVANPSVV